MTEQQKTEQRLTSQLVPLTRLIRLDVFSRACGLHPELIRRFVDLGLIDPTPPAGAPPVAADDLWFSASQISRVARMQRLRTELSLNYSALGLVLDLLDRIELLETAPRTET